MALAFSKSKNSERVRNQQEDELRKELKLERENNEQIRTTIEQLKPKIDLLEKKLEEALDIELSLRQEIECKDATIFMYRREQKQR